MLNHDHTSSNLWSQIFRERWAAVAISFVYLETLQSVRETLVYKRQVKLTCANLSVEVDLVRTLRITEQLSTSVG